MLDWRYLIGSREALFWPSSIMLMATDGHEQEPGVWLFIAISVGLNMLLYAVAFCVLLLVFHIVLILFRRGSRTV
jgi:hypothetical protein